MEIKRKYIIKVLKKVKESENENIKKAVESGSFLIGYSDCWNKIYDELIKKFEGSTDGSKIKEE